MTKQREFDRIVNQVLCFGEKDTAVMMGNAGNFSGFKYVKSVGPTKALKKYASRKLKNRYSELDEFNTSKLTTCCFIERTYMKKGPGRSRERKVIHCPQCATTWNRDVSASLNLLKIAIHTCPLHHLEQDVGNIFRGASTDSSR